MNTYEKWQELEEDRAFWEAKRETQESAKKRKNNAVKRKIIKKVRYEN
ncbi:hypothetical protein EV195_11253 [Tenacibaculum skagerrakense]|uniref:Uncharacterized protein n=1 Tax=Tenacibaculum skagerrakense TaxID=186571 RepID=A0A4R2NMD2_9FLAO|nr:hypothetical protein [Tenacibaculum skagerrakense]TCP22404.1 hypothetical protein EV195_11253 [Tenacibaculum skagerrakense]